MTKRSVAFAVIGVAIVSAFGIGAYQFKVYRGSVNASQDGLQNGQDGSSTVDLSDDRNLLGISHFLFVGKVTAQGGSQKFDMFTLYAYTVKVLLNIKGSLQGPLTVYTHGLQPGSTYLLAARWNENNWGLITALLDGRTTISTDASLTDEQLKSLSERNDRVIALQKAYPNEISFYGDVRHSTTWNSYQSLLSGHPFVPPSFEAPSPLPVGYNVPESPSNPTSSEPPVRTVRAARDGRRIGDLRQFQLGLSLYFERNKIYPQDLDQLIPAFLGPTLRDPLTGDKYGYATDGAHYVLSTKLEDPTNSFLGDLKDKQLGTDLDGKQLGINCDDPVYCVAG